MRYFFMIISFCLSGCSISITSPEEVAMAQKVCEKNGGWEMINKSFLLTFPADKYRCKNGAKFEK